MPTCRDCSREGSRGFVDVGDGDVRCINTEQCAKRIAKAQRAKLAGRCVDCLEAGDDPKGTRKLATKDDGTRQPGPRCVTHWRARKKDISSQAHAKRLEAKFEITHEQYWAVYEAQGGKCFGCAVATGRTKRLAVDHDHKLALEHGHDPDRGCPLCIRALLCGQCNQIIGRLGVEALQRLIIVLTDPPARKILCVQQGESITDEVKTMATEISADRVSALAHSVHGEVDDVAAELGLPTPSDAAEPAWIEEFADEDFGIPQSDVGVLEFFKVYPAPPDYADDNFWFAPVSE